MDKSEQRVLEGLLVVLEMWIPKVEKFQKFATQGSGTHDRSQYF